MNTTDLYNLLTPLNVFLVLLISTAILGFYIRYKERQDELLISEHFEDYSQHVKKKYVPQIYDKFYSSVYDTLFGNEMLREFEWYQIKQHTVDDTKDFTKNDINILDLGCGIGKHLKLFERDGYKATGVDISMDMLEKARMLNPDTRLVKADFMNRTIFKPREFTHAVCLFYTIYYTDQPKRLFENVNMWLKPNGYFAVHLVNPKKFDPVLEKSSKLLPMFNPQRHSDKRVTKTKLKFNKFQYVADWDFSGIQRKELGGKVSFTEHFLFNDAGKHVENKHELTMYPIKKYTDIADSCGFKLIKIVDLLPGGHDNSYVYIFQKKYEGEYGDKK